MPQLHHPLQTVLLGKKIISPDQWRVAMTEATEQNLSVQEVLVESGFVSEAVLMDLNEQSIGIHTIDLASVILDPALTQSVPRHVAEHFQFLPLFRENKTFHVAMTNPADLMTQDRIRHVYGADHEFRFYRVTRNQFIEAMSRAYDYTLGLETIFKEMDRTREALNMDDYANPTVRLVHAMLLEAVHNHASDIHLEPEAFFTRVRHRIDGILSPIITFHSRHWKPLSVRLKIMSGLDISETRLPQNGRFSQIIGGRSMDCRLSTHPTHFGESMVIRLLDKKHGVQSLSKLGFSKKHTALFKKIARNPQGLVVFTGPTGSGKTTTLYALLNHMQALSRNIMTLEQPIEYQLPLIRQTEIQEKGRFSFADGVRSLLRQDPDVLFVGEVRDEETASAVLRATMTGHPVYTTLHAGDCLTVIQRLVDLGLKTEDILTHLTCVVNQRLVRKICFHCHGGKPCNICHNTGFHGRFPLVEILRMNEEIAEFLREGLPLPMIRQHLINQGFTPLHQQAEKLLKQKLTTQAEISLILGEAAP